MWFLIHDCLNSRPRDRAKGIVRADPPNRTVHVSSTHPAPRLSVDGGLLSQRTVHLAGPVVCVFRKSAVLSPATRRFLPYLLLSVQLYCI